MKRRKELLLALSERAKTKSDINEHLELLYRMVAEIGVQRIVELGARGGNSTVALVIGANETGGHVVSVDHGKGAGYAGEQPTWEALTEASATITDKLGLGSYWTLVVKDDLEFAKEYHDMIELLMIDTDHSYDQLKKELASWGTKVIDGGFIVIHDTVSFPEMNKAIWEFLDEHPSSDYVEHKNCNGLGIIIKGTQSRGRDKTRSLLKDRATVLQWRISRMQESLLELRSRLVQREKEFPLMLEEQRREFEKSIPLLLDERRRELENQLVQRADDPLSALLFMYETRPDVRAAFPEVAQGEYLHLLQWARENVASKKDTAHQLLGKHLSWYQDNSLVQFASESAKFRETLQNLTLELARLQMRLAARVIAYENELAETSRSKDAEIATLQTESRSKDAEIATLQTQLGLIVSSATWRLVGVMKCFEQRHFPPGSKRGMEFQRLVKAVNRAVSRRLG